MLDAVWLRMLSSETNNAPITRKQVSNLASFDKIDAMPREQRQLVHEFGLPIVEALAKVGVTKPATVRFVVKSCWDGARSLDNSIGGAGTVSRKKVTGSRVQSHLQWLLVQCGGPSLDTLLRLLWDNGMVIVPRLVSDMMVEASIAETGRMGLVSKEQKHRGRLNAAIEAAARRLWPSLYRD